MKKEGEILNNETVGENVENEAMENSSIPQEGTRRRSFFLGSRMSSRQSRAERASIAFHPLDGLGRTAIFQTVDDLQKLLKHLELENMVFVHFLEENNPSALVEVEENIPSLQDSLSSSMKNVSFKLPARSTLTEKSLQSVPLNATPSSEVFKVSFVQRTDLVLREFDKIQIKLNESYKKCKKFKLNIHSKIEELETQKEELKDCLENFEKFRQNSEIITFQKFIRFLDESAKKFHLLVDKLRLRHSSLKVQYHKTCAILAHKKLIGENLQEIDFEQLRIENVHLTEKIEKKCALLLELKKITGAGNLTLSQQKKNLLQKLDTKEKLHEKIRQIENEIMKSDNDIMKLNNELNQVNDEFENIKKKVASCSAPDITDYIKKKVELENLNGELRMWTRRVNVKRLAADVAAKQLKKMLGGHPIDPLWLA